MSAEQKEIQTRASSGDGRRADSVEVTGHEQHRAWRRGQLPPIERLATDLWTIPMPMAGNPLRYVLVYVMGGDGSLTLIDTGWDTDESWSALEAGLSAIGASVADVSACLITHRHFDHLGLAGRVRAASGAWIGLHAADRDVIASREFRDPARSRSLDIKWLSRMGAPVAEAEMLRAARERHDTRAALALPDRLIEDGDGLRVSARTLQVVHTPGHTAGHVCFVDDKRGLVFVGDHVLPRISPHISADRSAQPSDALGDFMHSLDRIAGFDGLGVLPAHEWRFRGLAARATQLRMHHARRLAELLAAVGRRPESVPWELAGELRWSRPWSEYDGELKIFAVSETAAHLLHLERRGLVRASERAVPRYSAAGALPFFEALT